ncbi:MAG: hypothetical protein K9N35_11405 [Candidatus Marinimicrobia bacterium]|nr:hypothetical protein [Candidatus Neomarinimicrobiota bacterium]
MNKYLFILILIFFISSGSAFSQSEDFIKYKTFGPDMELLSYGGSLGGFFHFYPRENSSFSIESDWAIVENNDSFSYYYYNQPVTINNQNLSMVKVLAGYSWFPFMETMHPSLQLGTFGAVGPLISLNTDDDDTFLDRWQHVETDITAMIRLGIVVRVLNGEGSSYSFKLGYDYAKFDKIIDSRQTYEGLFFQAGMEFLHR